MGIHHVTAIAGDPQRNLNFYAGVLGLRLVKLTVNFDDPGTYHLYYGDERGSPGTILTFFAWPGMPKARAGVGQASAVSLAIPASAVSYWLGRLVHHGVAFKGPVSKLGNPVIEFSDPDGMNLELVGDQAANDIGGWSGGPVPPESAVRGIFGATLLESDLERTRGMLNDNLGFAAGAALDPVHRFQTGSEGVGRVIDVRAVGGFWSGALGVGAIHHIAFRAPDTDAQLTIRSRLQGRGISVTPVLDRRYFQSVYFHEPGGVLFEIATDGPGFTVDEPLDQLGTRLQLPPWLQSEEAAIKHRLAPLELPS